MESNGSLSRRAGTPPDRKPRRFRAPRSRDCSVDESSCSPRPGGRRPDAAVGRVADDISQPVAQAALDLPDIGFHQTLDRLIHSLRRSETQAREQVEQERLAIETEARERAGTERLTGRDETIVPGRIADGSLTQPVEQTPSRRETVPSIARASGKRVPRWVVAALAGAALAGSDAVVYWRTHSRPAITQIGPKAASGMARSAAGSGEAASGKRAPSMDSTMATPAPGKSPDRT